MFNPISTRPPIAAERVEVGHLEGDLVIVARNRSAIVTCFDRASWHLWLADLPDGYHADATLATVVEILEPIPEPLRRTLTLGPRPRDGPTRRAGQPHTTATMPLSR